MRWILGDLQGCVEPLETFLDHVSFDSSRDELWVAGDLINRGPASLATLRLWRSVGGRSVLGNHELYAIAAYQGRKQRRDDTLDTLFAASDVDELFTELTSLPVLVHLPAVGNGPEAWLVHAGIHPRWKDLPALAAELDDASRSSSFFERDDVRFAATVRCCTAEGERGRGSGPTCTAPYQPWDSFYHGPTLIVHGHWATRGHYRNAVALGLDSGAVYGGGLTAWCQDEDRIVHIPTRDQRLG
ncbi:MAG: metallophosphoesterase [Acidobacteriota bacterium]